jgi:hypothetical protein
VKGCNKEGNVFKVQGTGDKKVGRALEVAALVAGDAFTGQARVEARVEARMALSASRIPCQKAFC